MRDLTSGRWWTPGWPAKAMEMTKPGPCPQATEVPGHSSSPQTRLQDHVLCKHLLCARPLPWATIPHFSFFVWVRRIPEWAWGSCWAFFEEPFLINPQAYSIPQHESSPHFKFSIKFAPVRLKSRGKGQRE